MHNEGPILIAYDGSADADAAIDEAAMLLAGADAVVLYVRQPVEGFSAHLEGHPGLETVAGEPHDEAQRVAIAGAERARSAGLAADPKVANSMESVADTIVDVAEALDAALIVLGSRGRRGVKSVLLGSVSHHVLHHARRPAIVIPSPSLVEARRRTGEAIAAPAAGV